MSAPTRPVLRYFGGKWRLAPWIISFFPTHRAYVEPFGGAGSVLMRKAAASIEVFNDLDSDVINVFRVLRNPSQAAKLSRGLALTPYSRDEWNESFELSGDPIDRARQTIVRAYMGYGPKAAVSAQRTGFHTARRYSRVTSWLKAPAAITTYTARLRSVMVENCDAIELLQRFDAHDALHYCDPPYLGHGTHYRHKFAASDHERLSVALHGLAGMVVLSGYPHALPDRLYADWQRHERSHVAFAAAKRTEVVWLNPACSAALARERAQHDLELGAGA